MNIAIMQPYFFPYIGYWQLINAVDKFVILDDVNYIVRGWINRNRILINEEAHYINLPVLSPSQNKLINEVFLNEEYILYEKLLRKIELAYKKAPYFDDVYKLIEEVICYEERNLTKFLEFSLITINKFLGINTEILLSSNIIKDSSLKGEQKIIDICKILKTDRYINPIGGTSLYSKDNFLEHYLELKFLKTDDIKYKQFNSSFIPWLSIIDVIMFNDRKKIEGMLNSYSLVEN